MARKVRYTLPKSLTTVTTFSKIIALILFILMPFIGFYIGIKYQKTLDSMNNLTPVVISGQHQMKK